MKIFLGLGLVCSSICWAGDQDKLIYDALNAPEQAAPTPAGMLEWQKNVGRLSCFHAVYTDGVRPEEYGCTLYPEEL